jgi:hypothetical protein
VSRCASRCDLKNNPEHREGKNSFCTCIYGRVIGVGREALKGKVKLNSYRTSFLLAFPPKPCTHSSLPHACYMPCQPHPHLRDHSNCGVSFLGISLDDTPCQFKQNYSVPRVIERVFFYC